MSPELWLGWGAIGYLSVRGEMCFLVLFFFRRYDVGVDPFFFLALGVVGVGICVVVKIVATRTAVVAAGTGVQLARATYDGGSAFWLKFFSEMPGSSC